MNNYYERLAESLTKKYTQPLNEAWGENVPDWMKGPLARSAATNLKIENSKIYKKAYDDAIANGYSVYAARGRGRDAYAKVKGPIYDFADYQNPRSSSMSDYHKSLRNQFINAGIDLQNSDIKFIEGELPTSNKDPRLQPPNIGIWYIPSEKGRMYDQVYAKGINDLEKPYAPEVPVGNYNNTPFKDFSIKKLAEISSKFCYIDGATIKNRDFKELSNIRDKNNNDYKASINQGLERAPKAMSTSHNVDKSGYLVIPSSQKYADKLEQLKLKSWSKQLTALEESLNNLYSSYQKSVLSTDMLDITYEYESAIKSFMNLFKQAVSTYKIILNIIENISNKYTKNSNEFLSQLKNSDFKYYMDSCKYSIMRAKDAYKDYMLSEIDF